VIETPSTRAEGPNRGLTAASGSAQGRRKTVCELVFRLQSYGGDTVLGLSIGQPCRFSMSPCDFRVGPVFAGRRTVETTMSTDARTAQSRPVLQVGPLKPSLAKALQDDYAAYVLPDEPAEFLAEHGDEIRAVVTSGRTGVDAELMAAMPNLGAVVNFGVGYDTTDVDAAAARGVVVSNTPDVLTDCVADTAVGLVIDVMRQFSAADRYVRAGGWPVEGNYPLTRQVSSKRVGIIGLGRIGSAIST
jgi:hypothetical protein